MGTSKYSAEFRADAVALYHSSPGGTYASVAKDLGVNHETLRKRWNGASEARLAVFRWATRYNTRRRHSRLGQISPIAFEQRSTTLATAA